MYSPEKAVWASIVSEYNCIIIEIDLLYLLATLIL